MDLLPAHPYITIIIALIFWEVLKQVIGFIFKKATKDNYLTIEDFKTYQNDHSEKIKEIWECVGEIREILLIVAVNSGIRAEELKKLTSV